MHENIVIPWSWVLKWAECIWSWQVESHIMSARDCPFLWVSGLMDFGRLEQLIEKYLAESSRDIWNFACISKFHLFSQDNDVAEHFCQILFHYVCLVACCWSQVRCQTWAGAVNFIWSHPWNSPHYLHSMRSEDWQPNHLECSTITEVSWRFQWAWYHFAVGKTEANHAKRI